MTENLIEGLQRELERNRELLSIYESVPTGGFGALVIKQAIKRAESAIASDDVVNMIACYKELQEIE